MIWEGRTEFSGTLQLRDQYGEKKTSAVEAEGASGVKHSASLAEGGLAGVHRQLAESSSEVRLSIEAQLAAGVTGASILAATWCTSVSFIPDWIDRHEFDVQLEQELKQAVNSGLVCNYSHEVRVAIGAIVGVESVDSRDESRAQNPANDYLEFFGGQIGPFSSTSA
jgi:hypothetical protein